MVEPLQDKPINPNQNPSGSIEEILPEHSGWFRVKDLPSWAISLFLHGIILLVLARMTYTQQLEANLIPFVSTTEFDDWEPEELEVDDLEIVDTGNDSTLETQAESTLAAITPTDQTQESVEDDLTRAVQIEIDVPVFEQIASLQEAELVADVDVKGTSERAGGVDGAIDRLTLEIASSLRQEKTLVVWLLDASLSLKERRNAIADRVENIYEELGVMKLGAEGSLLTGVVSFGAQTNFLTDMPVEEASQAVNAIRQVQPDETGEEKVFSSVQTVVEKWKPFRTKQRRNFLIIIVTDERGDDHDLVDQVTYDLSRLGARVYCVGNSAVFGRRKGYQRYQLEDGSFRNLPVDQGPETGYPERLGLHFWGNDRSLDVFSSGFGPYALTRLCAETGGIYFIAAEQPGPKFDQDRMRNYSPDYPSFADYQEEVRSNPTVSALIKASLNTSNRETPAPRLVFRADQLERLKREIDDAQKPFADFVYHLENEVLEPLVNGERGRDQISKPRWQAGYDLAMGRALASWVRTFGYNKMLAQMKVSPLPFSKEGNNMWRLLPAEESDAGGKVKKYTEMARMYLQRVIDEHPDTPWAMLAAKELETPLGWQWQDGFNPNYREEAQQQQQPRPMLLLEEERQRRRMEQSRPKPKPVNIPKL
ncbi:MAG: VWA domain-containing protein [Planctomycetaceae bacterium]|nr:VWA domain-containing protein [Planctomycetaceae bacterium]